MNIVFENPHFLVVDKPAGWLSVPSRMGADDVRPCVGKFLEKERNTRLFPCHRLDEPVSGLLLFALTAHAHRAANGWFERGTIHKCYDALSQVPRAGEVPMGFSSPLPLPAIGVQTRWESLLTKGKKRAFVHATQGKPCVTLATLVERVTGVATGGEETLHWHLKPVTGRPHQLRFELYQRSSPILGDELYGGRLPWTSEGIALRVFELDFRKCDGATTFGLPPLVSTNGLFSPS